MTLVQKFAGHTPGPWSKDCLDKNDQRVVKAKHIEITTCWHRCVGSLEKEMEVNAALIAAAPWLIEVADKLAAALRELETATHYDKRSSRFQLAMIESCKTLKMYEEMVK